jgi:folate-dependent phosphoribosylglycinamide formyltransferase PurN
MEHQIVVLGVKMPEVNAVVNFLDIKFCLKALILEEKISKKQLLKGRLKKLGFIKVVGQLLFSLFIQLPLSKFSRTRTAHIARNYKLSLRDFDPNRTFYVKSVNDEACFELLKKLQPRLVFVAGTRIIGKKLLDSFPETIFLNVHAGITPAYRGVHGAYWALFAGDRQHCGVTVHFVDKGIDTGGILAQTLIEPSDDDNFCTYPWLQLAAALPMLERCIKNIEKGDFNIQKSNLSSKLWYHPTIWEYFLGRIRGIK